MVQLRREFLRRRIPGQFCASFRARNFRRSLSNAVCSSSWKRIILSHRECSVGLCKSFGRLLVVQGRPSFTRQLFNTRTVSCGCHCDQHNFELPICSENASIAVISARSPESAQAGVLLGRRRTFLYKNLHDHCGSSSNVPETTLRALFHEVDFPRRYFD